MRISILIVLIALFSAPAFADTCVYFFYGPGCPHCAAADEYIQTLEGKYPNIDVHRFNAAVEFELLFGLYDSYNVPEYIGGIPAWGSVPILFIGDEYLFGSGNIITNLEAEIQKCSEGCECPSPVEKKEISLPYILGLAAVDAINPCELAVLVILMTAILTRFPNEKKKALKAGLSFSSAIFLMYLIFGLLIILGFTFLTGVSEIKGSLFYIALGVLAIVLGVFNIKDAIWYGHGFLMEVPQKWRPRMKSIISGTASVKGAFLVGLVVSFFLTPCKIGRAHV